MTKKLTDEEKAERALQKVLAIPGLVEGIEALAHKIQVQIEEEERWEDQ